jgi:glycerol-3-phosphate O-acyltransferase
VTINYTRTLEGESFPNELTGEDKVKESLSRIVKAFSILAMNFGTIMVDFYEPIKLSDVLKSQTALYPSLNPYASKADRQKLNDTLGNQIVFTLRDYVRIMPTTLVASILLLYRKGISEEQLLKNVSWLGMALTKRGAIVAADGGLPNQSTLKIGLKHLEDYIVKKRNIYKPKVTAQDNQNYIMLAYYRNALNFVFFNESIIVCAILS